MDLEDEVEIRRMHAILHPPCFESLIRSLGLTPPDCRVDVPAFAVAEDQRDGDKPADDGHSRLLPPDFQEIRARLAGGASRRKQMASEVLRVVADDIDRARLELRAGATAHFEIDSGAEVIEVRSGYGGAESVVALFLLPYRGEQLVSCDAARTLENGDRLRVCLTATDSGASVDVRCDAVRAARILRWLSERQRMLASLATATLVALLAWRVFDQQKVVPHPSAPSPVLPVTSTKPAAQSQALETVAEYDRTRAARLGDREVSPANASAIYVDVQGESGARRAMREAITTAMKDQMRIVDAEKANTALKLLIEDQTADGNLTVSARLVDVNGQVIWPPDGVKRIYRGRVAAIAKQMIGDLSAARR
jgi:hypothetical protein